MKGNKSPGCGRGEQDQVLLLGALVARGFAAPCPRVLFQLANLWGEPGGTRCWCPLPFGNYPYHVPPPLSGLLFLIILTFLLKKTIYFLEVETLLPMDVLSRCCCLEHISPGGIIHICHKLNRRPGWSCSLPFPSLPCSSQVAALSKEKSQKESLKWFGQSGSTRHHSN